MKAESEMYVESDGGEIWASVENGREKRRGREKPSRESIRECVERSVPYEA